MALTTVSSDRLSTNVKNTNFTAAEKQDLTDDILPLSGQLGNRNLVINGNPIIYQRARTATDHGVYNYYTADRWRTSSNGSYTKTGQWNQEVVLDQSIPGIGGKVNYIKYTNTSAATSPTNASWGMNYRIENKDIAPYLGKVMTLSCYMKSDEGIEIRSGFISGTTSSSIPLAVVGDPNTYITLTPEWKRYTWTFTLGNTLPASHMDIGLRTQVDKAGSACYTCLQFEEGNVATPFEFRSYAEELGLCQRYFWREYKGTYEYSPGPTNGCGTLGQGTHPVTMRVKPTMSHSCTGSSVGNNGINSSAGQWTWYKQNSGYDGGASSYQTVANWNFATTPVNWHGGSYNFRPSDTSGTTALQTGELTYIQATAEL